MHWRLTRTKRERAQKLLLELLLPELLPELRRLQAHQEELQLQLLRLQQEQVLLQDSLLASQRQLLLEALRPLAAALQRQDSLASQHQAETRELLQEVLNSLQPPVSDQLFQRIGQPPPTTTSLRSAS